MNIQNEMQLKVDDLIEGKIPDVLFEQCKKDFFNQLKKSSFSEVFTDVVVGKKWFGLFNKYETRVSYQIKLGLWSDGSISYPNITNGCSISRHAIPYKTWAVDFCDRVIEETDFKNPRFSLQKEVYGNVVYLKLVFEQENYE